MKIIFLDIDGVLNHTPQWFDVNYFVWKWFRWEWEIPYQIEKKLAKRIEYIIKKTGAKVVISSTWRYTFTNTSQWY